MSATQFYWVGEPFLRKVGDTGPFDDDLEIETVAGSNQFVPLDLTGATVKFRLGTTSGAAIVDDQVATFRDQAAGKVRYAPTSGEVIALIAGDYRAEWVITWSLDSKVQTVPAGHAYRRVIVGAQAG
jgi:hypothetical protein